MCKASMGTEGGIQGLAWLEQRPECSQCPRDGKGLVGAESDKGGQGQPVRRSQSPAESVGRMEGLAERGKPQPASAFSGRGVVGEGGPWRSPGASPGAPDWHLEPCRESSMCNFFRKL